MTEPTHIPASLEKAVRKLRFEDESDKRIAMEALTNPPEPIKATIAWLAALVSRGGAKYDRDNHEHTQPHHWNLP